MPSATIVGADAATGTPAEGAMPSVPRPARSRSSRSSRTVCMRALGSNAHALATTARNAGGAAAAPASARPYVVASDGSTPVSMNPSTRPIAYTSVRASVGANPYCSGAAYPHVPSVVVSRVRAASPATVPACSRAMPKSMRCAPSSAMTMFAGVTSRWMMPCAWSSTTASHSWTAMAIASDAASRPCPATYRSSVTPGT